MLLASTLALVLRAAIHVLLDEQMLTPTRALRVYHVRLGSMLQLVRHHVCRVRAVRWTMTQMRRLRAPQPSMLNSGQVRLISLHDVREPLDQSGLAELALDAIKALGAF